MDSVCTVHTLSTVSYRTGYIVNRIHSIARLTNVDGTFYRLRVTSADGIEGLYYTAADSPAKAYAHARDADLTSWSY